MNGDKRFAILIDADNISSKYIKVILDEVSNDGIATYRRIYGDWTKPTLAPWKQTLLDYSVSPIQQYSYTTGKNATDSAMIIDAMDILYSGQVDGFCLVTSDSDFTRLAVRLREAGMIVLGMGEEKTPRAFIAACNSFKFIDKLSAQAEEPKVKATSAKTHKTAKAKAEPVTKKEEKAETSQTDSNTIRRAIVDLINTHSDEDGWMSLSEVGSLLSKRYTDFDVRNFGFKKMVPFVESLGSFEIRKIVNETENMQNGGSVIYIRLK